MFNQENVFVLLRYALVAAGSTFASQNWYSQSKWEFWVGIIVAAGSAGYAQFKTTTTQQAKTLDKVTDTGTLDSGTIAVIKNIADKVS